MSDISLIISITKRVYAWSLQSFASTGPEYSRDNGITTSTWDSRTPVFLNNILVLFSSVKNGSFLCHYTIPYFWYISYNIRGAPIPLCSYSPLSIATFASQSDQALSHDSSTGAYAFVLSKLLSLWYSDTREVEGSSGSLCTCADCRKNSKILSYSRGYL